jgi:hypothetical protein
MHTGGGPQDLSHFNSWQPGVRDTVEDVPVVPGAADVPADPVVAAPPDTTPPVALARESRRGPVSPTPPCAPAVLLHRHRNRPP